MGEVYRAKDTKLGRDVAIKTLPSELAKDSDRLARFEREAKLLAALNHPHIASVYNLDEHEGTQYLAMELIEGETLEEKLEAGALPLEDALRLGLQIAEALEAAHEKGVVHRDLKPANVMVTHDGQVKVLDFGLAKAFAGDPSQATPVHSPALSVAMTQQGLVLGTAGYMSPEQASGQATDQRADIWAFGVVLYEMLTGFPVFSGESVPHILAAVLQTEPDWSRLPKDLHPRVRQLLERCLEKKPRNRYAGMADARVDIEKVLGDPAGVSPAPATLSQPSSRRALPIAAAAAMVTAALAALIAWSFWPAGRALPVDRFEYQPPKGGGMSSGNSVLSVSPDGRRLVYRATDGLYLRSMNELETRPIVRTDEPSPNPFLSLLNPFFSPDGQSVAYFTDGELKRIAVDGGAPFVIAVGVTTPYGASWGRDGAILFGQPQGIFRVSANGGKPELVIPAKEGEQVYGPELLPDGDSVLFSVTASSGRTPVPLDWDAGRIVVQSLSTGKRTLLIQGGSDAHYLPTGHLIYALGDQLFAVAFDADTLTVSGGAVAVVSGVMRAAYHITAAANYAVSSDGTLVYANGVSGQTGTRATYTLVWVDRQGRETPLGVEPCKCLDPSVSPDGARVAVGETSPDETTSAIWVWSTANHSFTRLTLGAGFEGVPLWTPDGKKIAYMSVGEGVLVRQTDGLGSTELLLKGATVHPWAWTPDGKLIFNDDPHGNYDIGVVASTGDRKPRWLLSTKSDERRAALSPDGRWLAYDSNESGRNEVYVRPYPDVQAGWWQVSADGGEDPSWSGDGRTLFFLGPKSLMAAKVGSGTAFTFDPPKAVLDRGDYFFTGLSREYDVSPDGQKFLLLKPVTDADRPPPRIVFVTNWLQELKRAVPTK